MTDSFLEEFNTKYIQEKNVVLALSKYKADNSIALMLHADDGEPLCTATVCLIDSNEKPADGNVFIKEWSENEGVLKALQDNNIVGPVLREIPVGGYDAIAYECRLLLEAEA